MRTHEFWVYHSNVIDLIPYNELTTEQGSYVDNLIELNFGTLAIEETVRQIEVYLKSINYPF